MAPNNYGKITHLNKVEALLSPSITSRIPLTNMH